MNIRVIHKNKKRFLPLLLLADEQEDMIDRYLERGTMYVLEDGGVKAECVVTDEGGGILELKNLAVEPEAQRKGLRQGTDRLSCAPICGALCPLAGGYRRQPADRTVL